MAVMEVGRVLMATVAIAHDGTRLLGVVALTYVCLGNPFGFWVGTSLVSFN